MEALKKQKKMRSIAKASLTRRINDVKAALKQEDTAIEKVHEKHTAIEQALKEFQELHEQYHLMLTEEEDREESEAYQAAAEQAVRTVTQEIEQFVEAQQNDEGDGDVNPEEDLEVNPEDSASRAGSKQSAQSTTSSARVRIAARKAALEAKAALMKRKKEIELAELQLRHQKEELQLVTDLAMAAAEESAYAESVSGVEKLRTVSPKQSQAVLSPDADEWKPPGQQPTVIPGTMQIGQQQQILEALHLPKADLMSYDGDPLKYWVFMRSFQNSIDHTSLSDSAKLTRLLQCCKGKAARVVQCCAAMEPAEGYQRALDLLRSRFGNANLVAESWVQSITTGASISPGDKEALQEYADDLRSCQETLTAMGYVGELNNQRVLISVIERLPNFLRTRWVREVRRIRKKQERAPSIIDVVEFIVDASEEANDPIYGKLNPKGREAQGRTGHDESRSKQRGRGTTFVTTESVGSCIKCNGKNHSLFACDVFKGMDPYDRFLFSKENKLCYNCLKVGHRADRCRLERTCTVAGCGRKHTKFLHQQSPATSRDSVSTGPKGGNQARSSDASQEVRNSSENGFVTTSSEPESSCANIGAGNKRVALPIVVVKVYANDPNKSVLTYALLDNASTSTFCTTRLVQRLGISGEDCNLSLTTLEKTASVAKTKAVSINVEGVDGTSTLKLPTVYTRKVIPIREENIATQCDLDGWPHLRDVPLPQVEVSEVELLIGQNAPEALMPLEVKLGANGEPYAVRTSLGWTLNGPLGQGKHSQFVTSHFVSSNEALESQLKMFWKIDGTETLSQDTKGYSVEDKEAIALWDESVCQREGHYQLPIPFKQRPPNLPDNREVAEHRLALLGKRLRKDPGLYEQYCASMGETISEGHAHVIPKEELDGPEGSVWYLPHHPVRNPLKPDKTRIVYDCASKFRGVSLNDQVKQGPDLANKLLGVLLRFREDRIALMADIKAMFHQVHVTPPDQDVLRFLWWSDGDMQKQPDVYRMGVHLFGGTWSPSCCNYALQRTAEDHGQEFHPQTIKAVQRNFYVDDCLKSVGSYADAKQLYTELSELLGRGGFVLTKWLSNCPQLMEDIPEEHKSKCAKGIDFNHEALPVERALGVYWNVEEDCFSYKFSPRNKPITRRGLLSIVSSIYDPLGFACPFTIRAKGLIQELCRRGLGWDVPLPEDIMEKWLAWLQELPKLENLKVNRCIRPSDFGSDVRYELHHFADASEKAYGAVVYLRAIDADGRSHCFILMGKAHLAPLKQLTIPRLELAAATLSVKLDVMLRRELDIPIVQSYFWTDSTIVLQYISNREKRFHTFVANRIAVIHDGSSPSQWHHVPSEQNPADDVSRGLSPDEWGQGSRWLSGPGFLWQGNDQWPCEPVLGKLGKDPEVKDKRNADACLATVEADKSPVDKLLEGRSTWYGLKKDVAWILRYKHFLRNKASQKVLDDVGQRLSVQELEAAEAAIVKYVQRDIKGVSFSESGLHADKSSPVSKLDPYLSKSGVLHVGGRLRHAPLDDRSKHPVILPRGSSITSLIIKDCHENACHAGREHVLALLRERFWIIGARTAVRNVLKHCLPCKRSLQSPTVQKMGDLPEDRVSSGHPPFTYVGVDYFGPFMVKIGRSHVKRYGCIFTCLVVRAIHIEIAHSLDTDSFINALQRFMARRGKPLEMRSDNGSNFVGAEKELRKTIEDWNQVKIHDFLRQRLISWKFNPPLASHMGGAWERLIRATRKVLRSLTREQVLDDENLLTLMCLAEAVVNGRPLTHVSDDVRDLEPLTPNHLLLLRSGTGFPARQVSERDVYSKRRWRQVHYLADVFWRRWVREYLPLLQQRGKWLRPKRDIEVGDLVLLVDDDLPRNKWVLGRVLEAYPGKDRLVRSVKVKTQSSELVRPVRKLCLLETVESLEGNR